MAKRKPRPESVTAKNNRRLKELKLVGPQHVSEIPSIQAGRKHKKNKQVLQMKDIQEERIPINAATTPVSLKEHEVVTIVSFDEKREDEVGLKAEFVTELSADTPAGAILRGVVQDVAAGVITKTEREDSRFNEELRKQMEQGIVTPSQIFSAVIDGIHQWSVESVSWTDLPRGKERS